MLFGDGRKGNKFANAGVSENIIDSPLRVRDGLVETIKVGQFGNVSLNARNVAADCLHGLVEFFLAATRDEDIRTLLTKSVAVANPIPSVPPVMTATLPSSLLGIVFPCSCRVLMGVEPLPNIRDGILVERLVMTMRYVADMRRREYVVEGPEGMRRRRLLNTKWIVRMSARSNSSSLETRIAPAALAPSGVRFWLQAIRFIPKALPTRATCDPIRPSPRTPRVFPRRSVPTVCCQPPDRTELLSVTICRADAKISAQVNSIVGSDLYPVCTTAIP